MAIEGETYVYRRGAARGLDRCMKRIKRMVCSHNHPERAQSCLFSENKVYGQRHCRPHVELGSCLYGVTSLYLFTDGHMHKDG